MLIFTILFDYQITKPSSHFCSVAIALSSAKDVEVCCSRSSMVPIERQVSFQLSFSFAQMAGINLFTFKKCVYIRVKSLSSVLDF